VRFVRSVIAFFSGFGKRFSRPVSDRYAICDHCGEERPWNMFRADQDSGAIIRKPFSISEYAEINQRGDPAAKLKDAVVYIQLCKLCELEEPRLKEVTRQGSVFEYHWIGKDGRIYQYAEIPKNARLPHNWWKK